MTVFSVLIIGCGMIASGYDEQSGDPDAVLSHAGAFTRHAAFRLAACVEPDPARRAAFMARWGVPLGFGRLEEALASGLAFDLACVCTPTPAHGPALAALLAGPQKLVFCEKPLTDDLAEAEDLVARYAAAGKALAVDYTRRWDPAMAVLAAELQAGGLGPLQFAVAHYTKGILHNGGHLVDLLHMLIGPLVIDHVLATRPAVTPDDPAVDAVLRTGGGVPVHLLAADWTCFGLFEVHLTLREGRVSVIDSGFAVETRMREEDPRYGGYFHLGPARLRPTGLGGALLAAADNLAWVLAGTASPRCDGVTALATQRLCLGLSAAGSYQRGRAWPGC